MSDPKINVSNVFLKRILIQKILLFLSKMHLMLHNGLHVGN